MAKKKHRLSQNDPSKTPRPRRGPKPFDISNII
jgi:hypothetical protein